MTAPRHAAEWLALLPALAALALQWLLWPLIQPHAWFLFYPAVIAAAWIGGLRAGLAVSAAGAVLVPWLFNPQGAAVLFPALIFLILGALVSLLQDRLRRSVQQGRELFDKASDGIFIADLDGRYTDVNEAGCRLLGLERAEIIGKTIVDLIPPQEVPRLEQVREELLAGGSQVGEWSLRRKDGSYARVEVNAKILASGQWLGFVRDIGERERSQVQLRQAAIVFDSTMEGILITDAERRIVSVNHAFTSITGYEAHEVLGRSPGFQRSGRHDPAFYDAMWESLRRTGQWHGEVWNRRKNGDVYPAWENISAVRDISGQVSHYVAVQSDITPLKQAEDRLAHLAHHDALTGLPNRLLFGATLGQALERARRHERKLALLFIDLDRFKLVNDSLGHAAGDELLKIVGARIRHCLRAGDTVARLGGDEFTVALEEIGHAEEAAMLARKLIEEIARPMVLAGHDVAASASIGIALYPDDAGNVDDLTRAADAAMYRAKEGGRGIAQFYTPDITQRVVEHLSLENGLRRAIERDELVLMYQPQFDAATRRLLGMEALLRWRHPDYGLMLPERFIPVAEESGLINAVGAWVIDRACAQARAWADRGLRPVRIAINVSGRTVVHDHLVETVEASLRRHRIDSTGALLEIEMTESVLQKAERSTGVLERLRALGLRIAIDDFGTGYSSLSVLKHLPIDTLKIDRLFVRNLAEDRDGQAIVKAMISMAHALGLRVVAEGVETELQLAFLQAQACDEVQGFLFAQALSAEAIAEEWLDTAQADEAPRAVA